MIKKIKDYFDRLMEYAFRTNSTSSECIRGVNRLIQEMAEHRELAHCHFRSLQTEVAALSKYVSSIEMELLLQRQACLDNNFPGKTEM